MHSYIHPQLFLQTAEPVLEVLDEIGEVQARNPIISTLAEGQRRIDQDFREGVPVVDRIGAPFRAVQQGRNSIDLFVAEYVPEPVPSLGVLKHV